MLVQSISDKASAILTSILNYACRCIPGISTLLVIAFILVGHDSIGFIVLTLVYHALIVAFSVRTCRGIYATRRGMIKTAKQYSLTPLIPVSSSTFRILPVAGYDRRGSDVSSHSDEQNAESQVSTQIEDNSGALIHAIFVPNYKEHLDTLRESLSMLASHCMARSSYDVYLAMEAHEKDAESKALTLISEFSPLFRYITYTMHPTGMPGEARGKSSNLAWATRTASARYRILRHSNVVFTVMDADTHLLSSYFQAITAHCASKGSDNFTMFIPPIVFDRNANNISPVVRCADMYWSAAGIAGLYESSQIRTPTSVYSVTMALARYVNFWDTGPEAIGEDLHMYLKCFFGTGGLLDTVPIYSPASHCNVEHGDTTANMTIDQRWMLSSQARFKQACRHMWGIMDSGYATRRTISLIMGHSEAAEFCAEDDLAVADEKLSLNSLEKSSTPACASTPLLPSRFASPIPWQRIVILLHRLYEAHFLHVHYFINGFACSLLPMVTNVPPSSLLGKVLVYASYLRTIAFCGVVIQMFLYERLYSTALRLRLLSIQMTLSSPSFDVSLISESSAKSIEIVRQSLKQVDVSRRSGWKSLIDYILFPIAGTFYVLVPSLKAQILQFWSTEFVYEVSSKPVRSK
ncbi:uncharacterized protein V1513DRAFT_398308 [Lipomyces chichibuensis]|uniref:uncharacterized protein n=1 Tax=Lipomyces chichibuensis TaxID=1546026 RepID=UPI0033437F3D